MDWKLELVIVPVTDVDRAKAFYRRAESASRCDVDVEPNRPLESVSSSSHHPAPRARSRSGKGSASDTGLDEGPASGRHRHRGGARRARGARCEIGEPFHFGAEGRTDGVHPAREDYGTFLTFDDPDGNTWLVQEVRRS